MKNQSMSNYGVCQWLVIALGLITLSLTEANCLAAQDSPTDRPWWFGLNLGYGQINLTSDQAHYGNQGALAVAFHGGRKLGKQVRIGAELGAWSLDATNQNTALGLDAADLKKIPWQESGLNYLSALLDLFPVQSVPVYARVGAGWAGHWSNRMSEFGSSGWSWKAGAGGSIPLGNMFSLTPAFSYSQGYLDDIRNPILTETGRRYSVWDVTIGFACHLGEATGE